MNISSYRRYSYLCRLVIVLGLCRGILGLVLRCLFFRFIYAVFCVLVGGFRLGRCFLLRLLPGKICNYPGNLSNMVSHTQTAVSVAT